MDGVREKDEINGGDVAKTNVIFASMFSAVLNFCNILVNIIVIDKVG